MIRKNQTIHNFLNMASDAFFIFLSYSVAMFLRLEVLGGHTELDLLGLRCQLLAAECAVLVVFLYYLLQLYGSYRFEANGLPCVFSDKISKEVEQGENCCFLNLTQAPGKWASVLLKFGKRIENHVPDIRKEAKRLELFYQQIRECDLR